MSLFNCDRKQKKVAETLKNKCSIDSPIQDIHGLQWDKWS